MPDQLYRRCPDCRESESGSSCPTCGGERFIPAGVAPNDIAALARRDSRRWRFRISTLMLLVVIAALLSYIVAGWWREAREARLLEAARARAWAEEQRYQRVIAARANNAQAQAPLLEAARARAWAEEQRYQREIAARANAQAQAPASARPTE